MIETVGLTKEYGGRRAVNELSLLVEEGEIFGFLGPNGAGKTTTIRMLTGLLSPTGGKAMVAEMDAARRPQAVKRMVGVLPESQGYYGWMTGQEYLEYFGSLYGISRAHSRAKELLAAVGLAERVRTPVGSYSRGMRQRLGIARAMVHSPRVLFLDEPFLGLDPRGQREIIELIKSLNREEGVTIFLSSHLLSEVEGLCSRFAILREGRLVAGGDRSELEERLGRSRRLRLEVSDPPRALDLVREVSGIGEAHGENNALIVSPEGEGFSAPLIRVLVEDGVDVYSVQRLAPSLEEIFFGFTEYEEVES
ncbi:MAG: ABC transporter ATP-binding protein [Actinobacteria bacterium]|nr:ABC transporter ATP-binding protein [Actinomycetota bacterium]